LCDYDGPLPRDVDWRIKALAHHCGLGVAWVRYDRTRRGWHVIIQTRQRIAPGFLVAMQAILGSDWRREMFNVQRARRLRRVDPWWRDHWNVLYETKVRA
jgi:hypothetical protein